MTHGDPTVTEDPAEAPAIVISDKWRRIIVTAMAAITIVCLVLPLAGVAGTDISYFVFGLAGTTDLFDLIRQIPAENLPDWAGVVLQTTPDEMAGVPGGLAAIALVLGIVSLLLSIAVLIGSLPFGARWPILRKQFFGVLPLITFFLALAFIEEGFTAPAVEFWQPNVFVAIVATLVMALASVRMEPAMTIACVFILIILLVGTAYMLATQGVPSFLGPTYLLQQMQIASFLGITAAGMMMVILLGHIDLSVPWTLAAAGMLATAVGGASAELVGLGVGLAVGLINGIGVAYLRVPSMIFTLGINTVLLGLMVMLTGGFAPQTAATDVMLFLGRDRTIGIPHAVAIWVIVSVIIVFVLKRTTLGRYMYAIGNREAATYLSGVNTRLILIAAFVMCSLCAAVAGLLLSGYSSRAYQAMGDEYLLPSIAAVVLGGTHILGGKGRYAGTVVGAILIVLLESALSVMQMPEAGRQIIYGAVIILMLLIYGRGEKVQS